MTLSILISIFSTAAFIAALWFGRNKPPQYPPNKGVEWPVKRRSF